MVSAGTQSGLLRSERATPLSSDEAVAHCRQLARSHDENFQIVSWLTPRRMHEHLAILYSFCRTVDDLGDETAGDRLALLDRFQEDLDAAFNGTPRQPVLIALQRTLDAFDLPREPFDRLIEANRIDQRTTRYATFGELLSYCEHSANPVGRLVLMLYGYRDPEQFALSDATCTALQLANFWQDVARDFRMNRVYLPQDEMAEHGVVNADLANSHATPELCRLMAFQVSRAREYFAAGLPLIDRVQGHLKIDLALFSRGGMAILDKIDGQGGDTLRSRPTLSAPKKLSLLAGTLFSSRWRQTI